MVVVAVDAWGLCTKLLGESSLSVKVKISIFSKLLGHPVKRIQQRSERFSAVRLTATCDTGQQVPW